MPLNNTVHRWGSLAQALHWIIVVLIVTQFVLANMAESLPLGMAKLATLARHKSFGMTILMLVVLRLVWRVSQRQSPPLPVLKPYERFLAHLTHHGLYFLLFAMPLSGWIMSSAKNYPVSWFNLFTFPDWVAPNDTLFELMRSAHHWMALALLGLALLHIAAALHHHFIRKDSILLRMLPFTKLRGPQ